MRTLKVLCGWLLCLMLAAPAAADTYLDQAASRLTQVEAALAAMAPGDAGTANKLQRQLRYVISDLNNSAEQGSDAWRAQQQRHAALVEQVRARGAAAPAAEPVAAPAAQPAPASGEALTPQEESRLRFFDREYRSYQTELAALTARDLQDEATRALYDKRQRKLQETLDAVQHRDNDTYRERERHLAAFRARVQELTEAGAAQTGALGDIDEQIALFRSEIPETYSARLAGEPSADPRQPNLPSPDAVRAWLDEITAMREIIARGGEYFAQVRENSDRFQRDAELQRYANWFTRYLPRNFTQEVEESVREWPLIVRNGARLKTEDITNERLLMEGWAKRNLQLNELATAAAENYLLYRTEYAGDTDVTALREDLAHLQGVGALIRTRYADALKDVRLPDAVSSDAGLLATARTLLRAYGVGPYRALRINYDMHRKRDTRWYEGRLWLREWDEFQCAAAQQIVNEWRTDEWRIVYFNFRKDHRNVNNTNLGKWYFTGRMISLPILPANIPGFGGDDPGWVTENFGGDDPGW